MSRKLIALLLSHALMIGSFAAVAPSTAASLSNVLPETSIVTKNNPPLKPGAAAGIREAQGIADLDVWFISGLIVASIVAAILLADDDDSATGSTGAN